MAPLLRSLLPLCCAALLCNACHRDPDPPAGALVDEALQANARQQATDEQAAARESTLTLETEAGLYSATSGEDLPLPGGFPGDVVLPADARISSASHLGPTLSIGAHSPRGPALVFAEFRQAQRRAGWVEADVQDQAAVRVAGFDKDGRHLEASFVEEPGGGTGLVLTVAPRAPDRD